jgi:ribonuclease P protein component
VFSHGKRFHARGMVVVARANGLPYMRLGLSVGRRLGRAGARNRLKRVIREGFRLAPNRALGGLDLVVIPRRPEELQDPRAIERRLDRIMGAAYRELAGDRP